MPDEKQDATKTPPAEPSYDKRLNNDGWERYYLITKVENLKNPDPKQGTLGFKDAMTKKMVVINAPVEEWVRILTELAKERGVK